jgi:hypothetical protein
MQIKHSRRVGTEMGCRLIFPTPWSWVRFCDLHCPVQITEVTTCQLQV